MPIRIGDRAVGIDAEPFVIAEMSGNHNGSLDRALAIVEAAADAGASAVKLQTYTASSMTLDLARDEFVVADAASPWHGRTLYSLYDEASTPREWHPLIFNRGRELGVVVFSTPFDASAIDFLETLGAPCYKIASFEIVDLALIAKAAATGKPLIISTGLATADEVGDAVRTARSSGCKELILLKCTSSYPADPRDSNLATIPHMRDLYQCEVGLSDHTLGIGVAVASVAFGATVIEKHLTLSRSDGGVDAAFSLEPGELRDLVVESSRAKDGIGKIMISPTLAEESSRVFRRSLYVVEDMAAGGVLTYQNVRAIRPGFGLPPKFLDLVVGKSVKSAVPQGTPLVWELLE